MFKEGDIVYYIADNTEKYNLKHETPYEIQKVFLAEKLNVYLLVGIVFLFNEENIMLENDYIIMKRKHIIEKIRNKNENIIG